MQGCILIATYLHVETLPQTGVNMTEYAARLRQSMQLGYHRSAASMRQVCIKYMWQVCSRFIWDMKFMNIHDK